MIDWDISLGNLIIGGFTLCVWVVTATGFVYAQKNTNSLLGERLGTLGGRLITMENELRELARIVTVQAVQTNELASVKASLQAMENRFDRVQRELTDRLNSLEGGPRHKA